VYHCLNIIQVLQQLRTDSKTGLDKNEAAIRTEKYGHNQLPESNKESTLHKLLRQFTGSLILLLIAAAFISIIIGERLDAFVILVIVVLNGALGFLQEAHAERALESLKKISTEYTKVLRNSTISTIPIEDLVPGDIIIVESGDKVPADARILEAINFQVDESILTGESLPSQKTVDVINKENIAVGDMKNMIFKDTSVVVGRAKAVVVSTGINTEIGKIAKLLVGGENEKTPLAKELDLVGEKLTTFALIVIGAISILGFLSRNFTIKEIFLTSMSLAVAAIPEGLPAVITITLAIGVTRLAKKNAIIRKLPAVETIGATNYILTDKTGTLTKNQMAVTNILTEGKEYRVLVGRDNTCTYMNKENRIIDHSKTSSLGWFLKAAVLCNDSIISTSGSAGENELNIIGEPTENAFTELVHCSNLSVNNLRDSYERVYEIPFSSVNKKMIVVVKDPDNKDRLIVIAKGAAEVIQWMVTKDNEYVSDQNKKYASMGYRTLAFSYKNIKKAEFEKIKGMDNPEDELSVFHEFIGIAALKDPVREEVKDALYSARSAGIETIVVTGDHKLTAFNISKELELINSEDQIMDGSELGDIQGDELFNLLDKVKVFARVSPQQKLNIVEAVKNKGYIVAVTGDGVNDAPAIKSANIGISMGISGTDVSKEASDMVLQDDNYSTIVEAIKQGRIVYDNLVKFITFLISCNLSEIVVIAVVMSMAFFGAALPLPLLPIQILWINLVTDGLPALSLGLERGESDLMERPPRKQRSLLTRTRWIRMSYQALLISGATIFIFLYVMNKDMNITKELHIAIAQTSALTTLAMAQIFHAFNNRSERHSIFSKKLTQNVFLSVTAIFTILLQILIIYTDMGNKYLKTAPVPLDVLTLAIGLAIIPVIGTEVYKIISNKSVSGEA
jgi:P-type Ca2+ transporter type 2C